jgi:sugar phosphate isomerase/epimerase
MKSNRREFLIRTGAALTVAALFADSPLPSAADALGRPPGLQLYTVRDLLGKDFEGTLKRVADIGYREVEMAGYFDRKPLEIKKALADNGLHCASVHIQKGGTAEAAEYATAVGAHYVITSVISPKSIQSLTLDDYKPMAEQCNRIGEEAKKAGLQLGYHNHNVEFKPYPGGTGYDELLRSTDPELVKLELDCGWMAAAGQDPAAYITKYPNRYRLLHIKDFRPTASPSFGMWAGARPEPTELGRGHVDYKPIFAAARNDGIEWYYVEQEPPYSDMSPLEAIKVDYEYVHKFS